MSSKYARQIVLDTETTGLRPEEGHRIIEIGCIELVNRRFTRQHFHHYLNPQRESEAEALRVHGITDEFLQDKPLFADVAHDFLAFIRGAEVLIHNAPFDVGFLNHELARLGNDWGKIENYCTVVDTLAFAKTKHPGQRNSLDALCKRYQIDNSHRELHGALLDAQILADVYLQMTGGQESLLGDTKTATVIQPVVIPQFSGQRPPLKIIHCNEQEQAEHQQRLTAIDKASKGQCLWLTAH
jgi:DNA polymerase-3 subunit epsilon